MPINETDLDELLTLEEAAEVLRVSLRTMQRLVADRQIEVVRIGSGRGYPRVTRRMLLDNLNRRVVKPDRRTRSA
jgi:excisionase family DNA binding protein